MPFRLLLHRISTYRLSVRALHFRQIFREKRDLLLGPATHWAPMAALQVMPHHRNRFSRRCCSRSQHIHKWLGTLFCQNDGRQLKAALVEITGYSDLQAVYLGQQLVSYVLGTMCRCYTCKIHRKSYIIKKNPQLINPWSVNCRNPDELSDIQMNE